VATAWQDSHVALLLMCAGGLPWALTPLWQLEQLLTMPVWSKRAGSHASGEWQLSQELSLGMWPIGLPVAFVPSWQLAQVPITWA
jgi:hypothetical protein